MQIFYINLDSDLIKNEQMQFTLSSLGLNESTQRFPGILANKPLHGISNSETGCLLSHQQLYRIFPIITQPLFLKTMLF